MKILIVGSVASGKTTLARKLSNILEMKHYEIDSVVHDDSKGCKRSAKEQLKIFKEIDDNADWIIEGTLRKHLFYLASWADKIIFLDPPLRVRKFRIFTRFMKQLLRIEKCNYKVSWKMLKNMYKWTNEFEEDRDNFLEKIDKCQDKLVVLKSDKF